MIDIIRGHNRLNGLWFSVCEFAFILLLIGGFGMAHLVLRNVTFAIIELGIAFNCVPVVVIGVRMLRDRDETKSPSRSFWNKQARHQLKLENPHMLRDTLTLTTATIIPFALLLTVLYEVRNRS